MSENQPTARCIDATVSIGIYTDTKHEFEDLAVMLTSALRMPQSALGPTAAVLVEGGACS